MQRVTPAQVYGPGTKEQIQQALRERRLRVVAFRVPTANDVYVGTPYKLGTEGTPNYLLDFYTTSAVTFLSPRVPKFRLIVKPI